MRGKIVQILISLLCLNQIVVADSKQLPNFRFIGIWQDLEKGEKKTDYNTNQTFIIDYKDQTGYIQVFNEQGNQNQIIDGQLQFQLWSENFIQQGEDIILIQRQEDQNTTLSEKCLIKHSLEFKNFDQETLNQVELLIHLTSVDVSCQINLTMQAKLDTSKIQQENLILLAVFTLLYIIQLFGNQQMRKHIQINQNNSQKLLLLSFILNLLFNESIIFSIGYELYLQFYQIGYDGSLILIVFAAYVVAMTFSDLFLIIDLFKSKYYETFLEINKLRIIAQIALFYICLFMYSALLFVMQLYLTSSIVYEIIMISVFIPQLIYNFKYQVLNLNPIIFIELMGMKLFYFFYIRGCPYNIFGQEANQLYCEIALSLILFQITLFTLQFKFGPKRMSRFKCYNNSSDEVTNYNQCSNCYEEFSNNNQNQINQQQQIQSNFQCLENYCQIQHNCPNCQFEL